MYAREVVEASLPAALADKDSASNVLMLLMGTANRPEGVVAVVLISIELLLSSATVAE